jgi:2'-5' RNA ligase
MDFPVRTFFALVPTDATRDALARLAAELALRTQGRPTDHASIHMTLAFVGDVDEDRLAALRRIGDNLRGSAFDLMLDAIGGFARPQLAWAAPSLIPATLTDLQRDLAVMLEVGGFRSERRQFAPHLTLARKCAWIPSREAILPIPWHVDALLLWASPPAHGPRAYRELARWPLSPPVPSEGAAASDALPQGSP